MAKTPEQIYFQHEETLKATEEHKKLPQRCEQLEQLVKYMYRCYVLGHDWGVWGAPEQQWVEERMEQLGLLEGEQECLNPGLKTTGADIAGLRLMLLGRACAFLRKSSL